MQFFKQFLTRASAPTKITDGMVWFKTDLKLNLVAVGDKEEPQRDIQHQKMVHEAGVDQCIPDVLSTQDADKLFSNYLMRNASPCVSKGTVYGVRSELQLLVRSHSYYGMNKAVLDSNGTPNPAAVVKHLREINTSVDLKEPRLNKLFNYAVAEDFYDNSTSLLVCMLMKYYTLEFDKRMNVSDHIKKLTRTQVQQIEDAQIDQKVPLFSQMLKEGQDGVGCAANDHRMMYLVDAASLWLHRTEEPMLEMRLKVWNMYSYNDGHSTSGTHFGDHFGFVRGRYLRHDKFNWAIHNSMYIKAEKPGLQDTDALIESLSAWKGHLNMTNLTEEESALLDWCLHGNLRCSPFLIDQDLQFGLEHDSIRGVYLGRIGSINKAVTPTQILSLYNKLVKSHRWYEESLAAKNLLKYWVCQPATETVESHWWTYVPRRLVLPALGLKRAVFQCFLDGEAVSLTATALEDYKDSTNSIQSDLIAPSMLCNTAWYWGEFMSRNNALDVYDLHRKLMQPDDAEIRADLRSDAIVSAILGTGIRKSLFPGTATYIPGGLSDHYGIRVKFGNVNIVEAREHGYDVDPNYVVMNKLVAPSGVAMITGLPGTLQNSTPYGTIFSTNPMVKKYDCGNWRDAMNYNDIWAHGVVARWNGHDLDYAHPKHDGRHTVYAANDVSVAMPPVPPTADTNPTSYMFRGMHPRKYGFGTSFQWVTDRKLTFRWARTQSYMLDEPKWRSPPAYVHEAPAMNGLTMTATPLSASEYVTTLVCKYDIRTSGFHLSWSNAGVVLPQRQGPSELLAHEASVTNIQGANSETGQGPGPAPPDLPPT